MAFYLSVNLVCGVLLIVLLYKPLHCLRVSSLIINPFSVPVILLTFCSCGGLCIDT